MCVHKRHLATLSCCGLFKTWLPAHVVVNLVLKTGCVFLGRFVKGARARERESLPQFHCCGVQQNRVSSSRSAAPLKPNWTGKAVTAPRSSASDCPLMASSHSSVRNEGCQTLQLPPLQTAGSPDRQGRLSRTGATFLKRRS